MSSLFSSLKGELQISVGRLESRKSARQQVFASYSYDSFFIYDVQGLDSKRVWEEVFSRELDKNGNKLWIDAASVASFHRQNKSHVRSFSKSSGTEKLGRVDFASGPSRTGQNAIVTRFDKKYQRYYGNKRRQYHQLYNTGLQILPETHFSLHSAIRSVRYKNDEESVWFIKAPGVQRGQGILVKKGKELEDLLYHIGPQLPGRTENEVVEKSKDVTSKYIKNNKQWKKLVVQRAVSNGDIACIDGRKADLRLYILHCPNGLVYYYPNAVVRIAQEVYSGKDDMKIESQLTNVSIGGNIIEGKQWNLFCEALPSISELLNRVVSQSMDWFQIGRCELIGVDVMLDQAGKPWLIEMNNSPQMGGHGTPYLFRLKMLKEMLHLAVYPALRQHYRTVDSDLHARIPLEMSAENIEWTHLKDLSKIAQEQNWKLKATPNLMFFVRFTWVLDELYYLNKIIDYLQKTTGHDQGLRSYLKLLLNFKKTFEDEQRCEYLFKPSLNHGSLGCVGVIIHPSLPNEEIVCVGLNENFWTFEKKSCGL